MLSVILPSYNEQDNIKPTYEAISQLLDQNNIPYELVFVDDGSKDATFSNIMALTAISPNVKGVSFSRNFGKEAAIFAGLESCLGDCAVVMDCDLQHPPTILPEMYKLWTEGYEVIEAVKTDRGKESAFHKFCAQSFYRLISKATNIDMANASDFKLLDRKAIESLLIMPERTPFFRALSSWIGFKTIQIPFEVQERAIGTSKWSFKSLLKYAVNNITSFSGAPMQFITFLGYLMAIVSAGLSIEALYRYFTGTAQEGFTTVILMLAWMNTVLMLSLGIMGHYISKIYDEIKARPRYIIRTRCGYEEKKSPEN